MPHFTQKYFRNAIDSAKYQVSKDDQNGFQKANGLGKEVKISQSTSDLRGEKTSYKRKPSMFPTAVDIPVQRGYDKYGRKQSVMQLAKEVYNVQKSTVIKNAAVPMSTRRLSMAVKGGPIILIICLRTSPCGHVRIWRSRS